MTPTDLTPDRVAEIAGKLTKAQREWYTRGIVRIGNPQVSVPRVHPECPQRTWAALHNKGLLEYGLFGEQFSPLGLAVRAHLIGEKQ